MTLRIVVIIIVDTVNKGQLTLHDVAGDAHALRGREAAAHGGVQVARAPLRHQQHARRAARALHQRAQQPHHARVRRDAPTTLRRGVLAQLASADPLTSTF